MALHSALTLPDRRQRFKALMKRFNPSAPPLVAIDDGLIHEGTSRSVYKQLATAADLSPGGQHLVVGGIGSGKSTELLLAQRELAKHQGIIPIFIDVSAETDLSEINSGALLASLGLRLWESIPSQFGEVPTELQIAHGQIRKAAYGYQVPVSPGATERQIAEMRSLSLSKHVPGKLASPFPALKRDVEELAKSIDQLNVFLKRTGKESVVIFDGLDRLVKADRFWLIVEQDLRALRRLQISVLAAGPLSVMYGQGRSVKDYFDGVHYLPPAIADPRQSPFLLDVLRLRGAGDLMSDQQMWRLCLASGGVLRDLISLVRSCAEGAYLNDADAATDQDVEKAIHQLGNGYLLGLGTTQVKILKNIVKGGGFMPSDAVSLELLVTRRVLEQAGSRYEVHPSLVPLLPA
jgi:hypothetical protein